MNVSREVRGRAREPVAIGAGEQPRRAAPSLIPDFKKVERFEVPLETWRRFQESKSKKASDLGLMVDASARVVNAEEDGIVGSATIWVGFPWSHFEYLQQAEQLEHPFDAELAVPPEIAEAGKSSSN